MAPGALLASILVARTFSANRAVIERRLVEAARIDAAALDREFEGTIRALQALATSPSLDADDLGAFYAEAKRVQQGQANWYTVVVLSLDGQQLLNTVHAWGEPLLKAAEPESLQDLVTHRRPVVGAVRRDNRGGPERRFAIRVPVIRGGRLKYALTAAIDTAALSQLLPSHVEATELWTRAILDPEGAVAATSRDAPYFVADQARPELFARVTAKREQVFRDTSSEGAEVYASVSRTAFGWTAVVVVPVGVLDAAARGSTVALLTGAATLMFCGLLAVLGISRRLQREFAAAGEAADALVRARPIALVPARVAESQRLQESLRTAGELLQQRERERDREIERAEAARAEAEEANRTKDHFLAVLGHELRNPLAPAVTALEIMKVRDPTAFPRERQVLERQLAHMVRLVNDLLDLSRLARGKVQLHMRRFELRDAIDRAVDMARPLIEQHGHALHVAVPDTGLPIEADEDRIVQVLVNLLTNAAKYTPPKGHIALEARAIGPTIAIMCEDDGPGVPPELMAALFEPFAQGPRSLDRRHGGLGLGLALARSLTQLHGGTIQVENKSPEPGSRFIVRLSIASGEPQTPSDDVGQVSTLTPRRVIIVDDNLDARDMLRTALEAAGHIVATAGDGPEAISVAAALEPEVAILDIGLPGMSGYELAGLLRRHDPHIRLVALTGFGQASDSDAAARAGFDAHIVKPVSIATLLKQIDAQNISSVG